MNDNFHKTWMDYLQKMAWSWHNKYYFDAEEAYSELLVWYAEALNNYDASRGMSFDAFFYFYRCKALDALIRDSKSWKGEGVTHIEYTTISNLYSEDAVRTLHNMLIDLDKVYLSDDAKQMLDYILTTDFDENRQRSRVGKRTVLAKANKELNWTYQRASEAINNLRLFYGERAFA